MKSNPVKAKLRDGKPSFGTWLSLGDLHATRVLARCGFDWLTLDIEHSPIDWSRAAMLFAAVADAAERSVSAADEVLDAASAALAAAESQLAGD